eukprot:scaffold167813_cov30-Tisochrysis_lutea.AAC.5
MLRDGLLLRRPQPEVGGCGGGERGGDRNTLCGGGPDDDCLIRAARCEPLAVARVRDRVDLVLVSLERVEELSRGCLVDEQPRATCGEEMLAIGRKGEIVGLWAHVVLLRHTVTP